MIKYLNCDVVFLEIPDEVSLAINITNCPCHCKGCHSPQLSENIGTELTYNELVTLIDMHEGITCVLFMGGDANPYELEELAKQVKQSYPNLALAWYSGRDEIYHGCSYTYDYIKIGHYDESKGPLNSPTTNQKLFLVVKDDKYTQLQDITHQMQ